MGYVTRAEAAALTRTDQTEPVTVMVHPEEEGDAATIIPIPSDRIVHYRQYSVRNASVVALQVSPHWLPDRTL